VSPSRSAASAAVFRPAAISRPAALAASGARELPASAAPAALRLALRGVVDHGVDRAAVVSVERAVDLVMLGIRYLFSGSFRRASLSDVR
jgi:hypothetical protein